MKAKNFFIGFISLMFLANAHAQTFEEGTHYTVIEGTKPRPADAPIEIVEVFSYTCGHCYNFEPTIEQYRKNLPEGATFSRLHIKWDKVTENLSRAFYTAEALNNEAVHKALFDAIHLERKNVQLPADIEPIFVAAGVDAETFNKTYNSFGVTSKVKGAEAKIKEYRVESTPQLIVNGKYKIQPKNNITQAQMVEIATFLVAKIQAENS